MRPKFLHLTLTILQTGNVYLAALIPGPWTLHSHCQSLNPTLLNLLQPLCKFEAHKPEIEAPRPETPNPKPKASLTQCSFPDVPEPNSKPQTLNFLSQLNAARKICVPVGGFSQKFKNPKTLVSAFSQKSKNPKIYRPSLLAS